MKPLAHTLGVLRLTAVKKTMAAKCNYGALAMVAGVTLLLGAMASIQPVHASTIPVTSLLDDGSGGTLREALATALNDDTIDATAISGTIVLTSGQLVINKNLTILGPGAASLAISGNHASRVFYVSRGFVVTLASLTITDGHESLSYGGGIFNDHAVLTIRNCTIRGNSTGMNGSFWGGGIYNAGLNSGSATLTMVNSTLSGNSAPLGGGIYNFGIRGSATLTVVNSTFSGNSAKYGGGIGNDAGLSGSATLTMVNSTFSGNSAAYGGGIASSSATVTMGSTILNAGSSGANLQNYLGTVTSLGYNLSSDGTGPNDGSTDLLNTDPLLGPLQDNGGPTFTHAPLSGSAAIDQGINLTDSATDQRGAPRPCDDPNLPNVSGGDGSDIGAVESVCNRAPVALCKDVTVSADSHCEANASIDNGSFDPDADDTITLGQSPAGPYPLGQTLVTLTVMDSHGAASQCQAAVTVVDDTPPVLGPCPANQTVTATSTAGAVVTFAPPSATDNCSVSVNCVPASGGNFPLGASSVTCTAMDGSGNSAQGSFNVNVVYSWSSFLQPVNADGSSVFKAGSTVNVKFQLTGASAGIGNAVATLSYAMIGGGVAGSVNEAASNSAATAGNLFRYDAATSQYFYNWSTKGLTTGTYQLSVNLGDGVARTVNVGLK